MKVLPLIFMGSPAVAVVILKALLEAGHEIHAVVTQPDRPAGRGRLLTAPPVKVFAESKGLHVLQPRGPKDLDFIQELKSLHPEAIVVAAYGRILPPEILKLPRYGCLNLHFSLLPHYRGASCVASAILHGEKETGVTVLKMVEKLDAGAVLKQERVSIFPDETTGELELRLATQGGPLLLEVLDHLEEALQQARQQEEFEASFAPLLKKEDAKIDWNQPAEKIYRLIRAMQPWPVAFTFLEGQRMKIYRAEVIPRGAAVKKEKPGTLLKIGTNEIEVACAEQSLQIVSLQLEGKRRMSIAELIHGYKNQFKMGLRFE